MIIENNLYSGITTGTSKINGISGLVKAPIYCRDQRLGRVIFQRWGHF